MTRLYWNHCSDPEDVGANFQTPAYPVIVVVESIAARTTIDVTGSDPWC